ncbi:hypothetical protein GE061_019606 [Apolygus lucorum]|uniref:Major facilitator superfamily (MFS) profile domain-containing protein n=1 Tax=Apolygus lucorum TaxID=248454 RepID=A0A8S9XA95_APOLU|nr:hypothetical protein GE061_019606 [Apolygus lucorum]
MKPIFGNVGCRHIQMILSFWGLANLGLLTQSQYIGLVAMTDSSGNASFPILTYTIEQKGIISSVFGYGMTLGNVVAGQLADKFGPMRIWPVAAGIFSGLLSLVLPSASVYFGFETACILRFIQGLGMSFTTPSVYVHMSKWVVPKEQAKFSWIWTGRQVGSLIVLALSGPLANSVAGWPAVFYFPGAFSIVWGLACLWWGFSTPSQHSTISRDEKEFIESSLSGVSNVNFKNHKTPWRAMLLSLPQWAFTLTQTCHWYVNDSIFSMEPTYLNKIFGFSVETTGFMSALNFLVYIPVSFLFALVAMLTNSYLRTDVSRKLWTTVGLLGGSLSLLLLALLPLDSTQSVIAFIFFCAVNSAVHQGYMINILDIAPNLAGTIAGSIGTVSNVISSAGPMVIGYMITDEQDQSSWRNVFLLNAGVFALGNLIFISLGSTEIQPWNDPNFSTKNFNEKKKQDCEQERHKKAVRSDCLPLEQVWSIPKIQTDTIKNDQEIPVVERTTRTRHKQVILSFLGVTVFGLQSSCLSLGLVAMSDRNDGSSYAVQNYTLGQKGIMSGMMGYGNSIGNMVLGLLAHRFHVMSILPLASGFFSGTMAFIVPLAALYVGFKTACLAVLLQGVGLSFVYPCVYVHLSKWVVPHEQAKFSWVWSGHQVGHLIVMMTSGALYASPGGWPSVFYVPGIIGIFWAIAFLIWGVRSPAHHQTISPSEREFIERHLKPKMKDKMGNEIVLRGSKTHDEIPWRSITTSVPMWALLIVQISDLWVSECTMGPFFLHSVCRLSVMTVGLMTGLAYIGNIIAGVIFACMADRITDKLGFNFSRKFWTAVGLYGGSVSLLLLAIVRRHCYIATLFLESRIVINAATHPGYMSTILNVAPNLAATIASAFNAVASFLASTGPLYTGLIVKDEYNVLEWDIIFCTCIAVYVVGCTTFIIFGSTDAQDWDAPHVTTELGRMSPSIFEELPPKSRKQSSVETELFEKSQQTLTKSTTFVSEV